MVGYLYQRPTELTGARAGIHPALTAYPILEESRHHDVEGEAQLLKHFLQRGADLDERTTCGNHHLAVPQRGIASTNGAKPLDDQGLVAALGK